MPEQVTIHAADHRDECFLCYGPVAVRCPSCGQGWCIRALAWVMLCSLCGDELPASGSARMSAPSNRPSRETIERRVAGLAEYAAEVAA